MKFCNVCFSPVFGCSVYERNKDMHLNSLLRSWPVTANAGCVFRLQQRVSVCLRQKSLKGRASRCCARSHRGKGNRIRAPLVFQCESYLIGSVNS